MRYTASTRNSMWSNWFNQYRQYRAQELMIRPLLITYVCDWMTPTCRHWLTVQSCNAEIGELHSHAMQTYGNGTVVQCRHLGIIVSGHADIGRLYIRATQILGAYIVVLYRHCVIGQSCSWGIGWLYSHAMQTLGDLSVLQFKHSHDITVEKNSRKLNSWSLQILSD